MPSSTSPLPTTSTSSTIIEPTVRHRVQDESNLLSSTHLTYNSQSESHLHHLRRQQQHRLLRHQRSLPENSSDTWRAVAEAAHRAEIARQEHLILQQQHERLRLRERLGTSVQSSNEMPSEWSTAASAGSRQSVPQEAGQLRRTNIRHRDSSTHSPSHQVYLINCKGCGNFLTDRGMRAILLLKPHVTLFSTDIMPTTCGPLFPPSQMPASGQDLSAGASQERTCDCLTQTLGCYGCGAQVGYHIVNPCARCTASVQDTPKGSNGHRTVLHCSEVTVRERRYVPGEPGVMCSSPPPPRETFPVLLSSARCPNGSSVSEFTAHVQRTPFVADAQHQLARAALARQFARVAENPNNGDGEYNVVQSSNPRIVRIDSDRTWAPSLTEDSLWSIGTSAELHLDALELDMEKAEAAARMEEFGGNGPGAANYLHGESQDRGNLNSGFESSSGSFGNSKTDASTRGARRIERGGRVYWSDLVAGGERAEPIDCDDLLSMPIAGR